MQSDELQGLLWASQYAAKICIRCNKFLGRFIGASSSSPIHIWVQCQCSECQTRESVGFADGGNILNLTEFAQHACAQSPSLKLFTVVQPGAPKDQMSLLDWLKSANQYMGGDALVRRQLCIFWSGFGDRDKTDVPNTWRSATIRRIDKDTGACEIKYHDDRRKRSQAFLYLPLTVMHFARCPPPPGAAPRNVADGQMPLPPVLPPLLPPPPPLINEHQMYLQPSASSVMRPLLQSAFGTVMTSVPSPPMQPPPAATSSPSFCHSSSTSLAPATIMAAASTPVTAAAISAAENTLQLAATNYNNNYTPSPVRILPPATHEVCSSSHPLSYPMGSLFREASEQSHLLESRSRSRSGSRSGSSGAVGQSISSTPTAPEAPAKRPWVPSAPSTSMELTSGPPGEPYGADAAVFSEFGQPRLKLLRGCGGGDPLQKQLTAVMSPGKPADYATCHLSSGALNDSSAATASPVRLAAVKSNSSGSSNVLGAVGAAATPVAAAAGPPIAICHRPLPSPSLPSLGAPTHGLSRPYCWSAHELSYSSAATTPLPPHVGATAALGCGSADGAGHGNGSGSGGVSGSSNSNSDSSSISLFAATAAVSSDRGGHSWGIHGGGMASASYPVGPALPSDCTSYSFGRSSSSHASANDGNSAQLTSPPESWAGVFPLQPPTSAALEAAMTGTATAVAVAGGSAITAAAPRLPSSSTAPAAVMPTMTLPLTASAAEAATNPDAALDAFLAASFDFFADSDQPDYPGGVQWLSEIGSGNGPVAPAPVTASQHAITSVMQGPPCGSSVTASPCVGFVSPVQGNFLRNSISCTLAAIGGGSSSAAPGIVLGGAPGGPVLVNGLGSNQSSQSMPWFDGSPWAVQGERPC
ncbi:hypothetical protein VaNZ11_012240 [Volvox africanus]|uniref:Uncharacterized protein n=1 Tax=Volvox africanus TaxID=51714 RepID=A0ABQ5SE29_9CHLO|nr:hypothetical protein VaNZ11_012240 [Volvox africanus]